MSEEGESVRGKIKKKKCTTYKKFIWRDVHTSNIFFQFQDLIFIHFVVQTKIRTEHHIHHTTTFVNCPRSYLSYCVIK